jgi:hypothetical protein
VPIGVLSNVAGIGVSGVDVSATGRHIATRDRAITGTWKGGAADPPVAARFTASLTVSNVVEFGGSLVFVIVDDAGTAC